MDKLREAELMRKIQELEFTCCDLFLYCDTHPCDEEALRALAEYSDALRKYKAVYDAQEAPLQNFGYSALDNCWVDAAPWPWER